MRYLFLTINLISCGILLRSLWRNQRSFFALRMHDYQKPRISRFLFTVVSMGIFALICIFNIAAILTSPNLRIWDICSTAVLFFVCLFTYHMVEWLNRLRISLIRNSDEITQAMVNAIEAKDAYTQGHSLHVHSIVELFYHQLPEEVKAQINPAHLMEAAILHDIGKIGIRDNVLNKPGKLTDEEMALIRQHPLLGKKIIDDTNHAHVSQIIYCHHERIDGKGYYGVPGERIPIESKIIAIADTFSALSTDRVYRTRYSYDQAVEILSDAAGTQLDEHLVQIFLLIPRARLEEVQNTVFAH